MVFSLWTEAYNQLKWSADNLKTRLLNELHTYHNTVL